MLIILGNNNICGPIHTCDHFTMNHQHQWPHTNISNMSGLWYQGYKPGVKRHWNLLTYVIQDIIHTGYNVETTFQLYKIIFLTFDNTTY